MSAVGVLAVLGRRIVQLQALVDAQKNFIADHKQWWEPADPGNKGAKKALNRLTAELTEATEARGAIDELLNALHEDMTKPFSIVLNYSDRVEGEPEGFEWWAYKQDQMESDGYFRAIEYDNGGELFARDGYTDRLHIALSRCKGEA